GAEPKMPKGGPPLPAEQVSLLRRWVQEGARDDSVAAKALFTAEHPPVYHLSPLSTALAYSPDGKTPAVSRYHEVLLHHAGATGRGAARRGTPSPRRRRHERPRRRRPPANRSRVASDASAR